MITIHTDPLHRIAYSTDASAYREMPYGVAYPETKDDIIKLIQYAKLHHTCLIPRAGGTSIAGQVVGRGVVVDVSKHFNHILEINPEEKWARVEPGVVRDELNIALKPYGLFFSPETSTSNRCCIGGMVGNNSCGAHSLVYGSTRHHVLQLKGVLSDGSFFDTAQPGDGSLEKRIYSQLEAWESDEAICKLIAENFPDISLKRRSCGYAIDETLGIVDCSLSGGNSAESKIDLCKLICGSEGTLCLITEIKLSLDELPSENNMVVCAHCDSIEKSFLANLVALRHKPVAVELMDGKILELGKGNPSAERNRFFVQGNPAALIIAEFNTLPEEVCDREDESVGARQLIELRAKAFEDDLKKEGLAYSCTRVYGNDVSRVWALRKSGLGVLSGMKGDAKPVGVIEDTAVAPQRMPEYMADFRAMMERIGLECVYYGHISTGELHLRPILNMKTEEGRSKFREVAEETAKMVRKHKGSLSGEHGDGRLRGEFIPLMYGNECYQLMREVKHCWDPDGIFNTGKITDTPPMDEFLRFSANQQYELEKQIGRDNTYFNWRAAFDECKVKGASGVKSHTHALMCSIEQCNGAGDCRKSKLIGGTLCPAFKVSEGDELESTRARANVLREILTNGLNGNVLDSPELKEMLYSCLSCKGCRGECPSGVDMTRIRAELLQHIYDRQGTPFRSWMVARMPSIERLGSYMYPLYNFAARWKPSAALIKKIVSFAPPRTIPQLHPCRLKTEAVKSAGSKKVYLYLDEFTKYQEPQLAQSLIDLLQGLGYNVIVPDLGESGRAAISKGCLKLARKLALKNVCKALEFVSKDAPLIGIEPSCILAFRDEYPDLVPPQMRAKAKELAANCLLYDEFFMSEVQAGRISAEQFKGDACEIWLHGHCHQKALVGIEKTAAMLGFLKGAKVNVIPSGCCGMAGSFGYERENYWKSMAIGEMILFPTVRKAVACGKGKAIPVFVAAPGTSCRQQIYDGTEIRAVHPILIMQRMMK